MIGANAFQRDAAEAGLHVATDDGNLKFPYLIALVPVSLCCCARIFCLKV